jgi:hypothetical protein
MKELERWGHVVAVCALIGLVAFFMGYTTAGGFSKTVATTTTTTTMETTYAWDSSMAATAQALVQKLAQYTIQPCTDAIVSGCGTPTGNATIAYEGFGLIDATWNMTTKACQGCYLSVDFQWDGTGFKIVNPIHPWQAGGPA